MSDEGRTPELLIALEWLTTVLKSDAELMAAFDGAIYEDTAPMDAPAMYLVYRNASPLGEVLHGEGGRRIWVSFTFDIIGWIERDDLMALGAGMRRVDALLTNRRHVRTTLFPGIVQECTLQFAYTPPSEIRPDEGVSRGIGGRYTIRVSADVSS